MTTLCMNLNVYFLLKEHIYNAQTILLFIADIKNRAESAEVSGSEEASVVNTKIITYT